jgi:glycerophosphoryl diester phosphodiesterase
MRVGLIFCCVALGLLMSDHLAISAETSAAKPAVKPFFRRPWLLGAHRGGAQLSPENTVVAFKAAAERWPDVVLETDARLTSDGHVVLLHDGRVDRTTDGKGLVAEMTLAEVKKLDAGFRFTRDGGKTFPYRGKGVTIATLTEALAACPSSRFEIEMKPAEGVVEPTIRVIRQAKAEDRVLLASFDPRVMYRARKLAPNVASCYTVVDGLGMLRKLREGGESWESYKPKADVLSLMQRMLKEFDLTADEFRAIRAKGVRVQFHTPNTRERIIKLLDLKPDSILTDRPDLLSDIIAERK